MNYSGRLSLYRNNNFTPIALAPRSTRLTVQIDIVRSSQAPSGRAYLEVRCDPKSSWVRAKDRTTNNDLFVALEGTTQTGIIEFEGVYEQARIVYVANPFAGAIPPTPQAEVQNDYWTMSFVVAP